MKYFYKNGRRHCKYVQKYKFYFDRVLKFVVHKKSAQRYIIAPIDN